MKRLNRQILETYFRDTKPLTKVDSNEYDFKAQLWGNADGFLSEEEIEKVKEEFLSPFIASPKIEFVDEVNLNTKKNPFYLISIRITDEYMTIIKQIPRRFSITSAKPLKPYFSYQTEYEHILFYDTLDVMFKSRNMYYKPVRLGHPFGGVNKDTLLFDGLELFYQVNDFRKESLNTASDIATTVSFGDLLRAQRDGLNKKELLKQHLKNADKLDGVINFNKFSVAEGYMLVKMQTEFNEKEFANFVRWYKEKGRKEKLRCRHDFKTQRTEFATLFILDKIGISPEVLNDAFNEDANYYYTAKDYFRMCRSRRRKIKINFSSKRKLEEEHDKLYASTINKSQRGEDYYNDFEVFKEYKPLVAALKKRKSGFKYLSKPFELVKEGNKMGHCVGSYINFVKRGECIIATTILDGVNYTLELAAVMKDNKLQGYSLEQMQSRFNGGVKKPEHEAIVIDFLNKIEIPI